MEAVECEVWAEPPGDETVPVLSSVTGYSGFCVGSRAPRGSYGHSAGCPATASVLGVTARALVVGGFWSEGGREGRRGPAVG